MGLNKMKKRLHVSVIVPTLNEDKNIGNLFRSLKNQTWNNFEIIVVDGGSTDRTVEIAKGYQAKVVVENGCPEFLSRNIGAKRANGEILLFICADVMFPENLLEKIHHEFEVDQELIALTGPDKPQNSLLAEIEYGAYNLVRYLFSALPRPLKKFSTSTNFLAIRKKHFEKTGGFISDINADGIMGNQLSEMGQVKFCPNMHVFISPRRFMNMGFFNFNLHYLYVLENFFPFLSRASFLKKLKQKSEATHGKLHELP